jgi:cell fate (sporulation/competence/biofilm development) regulator YlbF (YheA/YmcA/DUF963 family)
MKFNKQKVKATIMEQLSEQPGLDTSKMEKLLDDLLDELESLNLSIDYLTSAVTGDDPLSLDISQAALGRLGRAAQAKNAKLNETKSKLKTIIEEVISEQDKVKLGTKGMTQTAQAGELRSQAKGVQSGEIGGDFTNIERSLVQQISDVVTKIASAPDVDLGKYRGQLNTVLNRLKDLTGAELD